MVFNVFGHRLVQLSDPRLRRIYEGILLYYCVYGRSLGPSIVFSNVLPRIIHMVSAAATTAPIRVIYSFIKQLTEGRRANFI
jgi:hypothetical protein